MQRDFSSTFGLAVFLLFTLYFVDDAVGQQGNKTIPTGLEVTGPPVRSAPVATVLGTSSAPAAVGPALAVPEAASGGQTPLMLAPDRQGKLEAYIRNNASVLKTEQLRSDPRVSALPQQVRADFLNEFGTLMFSTALPSRDWLLQRTSAIDKEQMEMADRAIKLREDVAEFHVNEAALAAEIEQHNKKAATHKGDLEAYQTDLGAYETRTSSYTQRLEEYQGQIGSHNAEVANYDAQCAGRTLPSGPYAQCVAWQGRLNSRKSVLDGSKAQLDAQRATLQQEADQLNRRHTSLDNRAAEINARKADLDKQIVLLEKRRTELLAEQKKIADWETGIKPQWDFEVQQIEAWRALLDKFNARLEQALSQVQPPTQQGGGYTGNWSDADKQVVAAALGSLKDSDLKKWVMSHAELNRFAADKFSPITANGPTLRFKDGFFEINNSASRENLLAFESGKVFWNQTKDRHLADGRTLESWFVDYSSSHSSTIADMKAARHDGENLGGLGDFDGPSQFGYAFRAQALELSAEGNASQSAWNQALTEFRGRIAPLLLDEK